jgi:hypothetical protein
MIFSS